MSETYRALRDSYNDATRRIDEAIGGLADVLTELKEWKRFRDESQDSESHLRESIRWSRLLPPDEFKSLLQSWLEAAEAEYNHFLSANDDSLAPPRVWHRAS
jgi:hypothetical protein